MDRAEEIFVFDKESEDSERTGAICAAEWIEVYDLDFDLLLDWKEAELFLYECDGLRLKCLMLEQLAVEVDLITVLHDEDIGDRDAEQSDALIDLMTEIGISKLVGFDDGFDIDCIWRIDKAPQDPVGRTVEQEFCVLDEPRFRDIGLQTAFFSAFAQGTVEIYDGVSHFSDVVIFLDAHLLCIEVRAEQTVSDMIK